MKKTLLTIYFSGLIILLIFFLLQIILGDNYIDKPIIPWVWLLVLYLPTLYLTFQIREKVRVKVSGLKWMSILFVFLTICVVLSQPAFKKSSISFADTLIYSMIFLIPFELFIGYLIHRKIIKKQSINSLEDSISENPIVFISYNHGDQVVAQKIYDVLQREKIEVMMDNQKMEAGEDIKNFIDTCVKESNITLSLVSNNSLRSAWVAMETTNTFFLEKFSAHKKFIGCYLDEDFFQPDFTLNAISDIEKKIKENQELIPKYHEKMLDTRDLNNQNTRLLELRNNLDEIVRRLRESLCLDVRPEKFDQSMQQLIKSLKSEG